jgi:glycosyltransferase involved in cell wall biosynthesis
MSKNYPNILVSISCITFNHEPFIRDCLNGFVIQQTNFDLEILVHDDASSDGTALIIKEYEERFPHLFKVIYQTENQYSKGVKGIMRTFNFPRAQGKYIALCEGDDYWTDPFKLQKQIDFLESNPDFSMCFHRSMIESHVSFGPKSGVSKNFGKNKIFDQNSFFFEGGSTAPTAAIVFRKSVVEYFPDFYFLSPVGDMALKLMYFIHGKIYFLEDVMSVRRFGVQGSWNIRFKRNKTLQVNHYQKMILMLEEFNRYTSSKWKYEVEKRCIICYLDMYALGLAPLINIKNVYPDFYASLNFKSSLELFYIFFKTVIKKFIR